MPRAKRALHGHFPRFGLPSKRLTVSRTALSLKASRRLDRMSAPLRDLVSIGGTQRKELGHPLPRSLSRHELERAVRNDRMSIGESGWRNTLI